MLAVPRVAAALVFACALAGATGCLDKSAEHRVRANAFLRGNDAASALKECDEGLAARKGDLPLLILRGKALFELDRLDESRAAYAEAVRVGEPEEGLSAMSEAHLGLAMIASRQHDWAAARGEFSLLVKANDKDATSHMNVAKACLELKDIPCAIEHGESAQHLRDRDENVLFTLGTIYLAAKQIDDASKTFQRICDVVPGAATCPYGLALSATARGDNDKALTELAEAVQRKLPNPDRLATDPAFAPLRQDPRFVALTTKAAAPLK